MGKIKLKTRKAAAKRFKRTGTGKLKHRCQNRAHLAKFKSTKQKRHLKKNRTLSRAANRILEQQIPN
ncbi:MAG: 50S ribosomal protein L35 [Mycoplasmataceae bacterium]|jgi:large subunit ribosomal protein L35|nr:50S ribosomal protein L35 [Mycoplasmataceae bacterium]